MDDNYFYVNATEKCLCVSGKRQKIEWHAMEIKKVCIINSTSINNWDTTAQYFVNEDFKILHIFYIPLNSKVTDKKTDKKGFWYL